MRGHCEVDTAINPNGAHHREPIPGADHIQGATYEAFRYWPITIGKYSAHPRPAFAMKCGALDGYKTRAMTLIGDYLKCPYSHRRGYTVSPAKLAKFLKLYAEGRAASPITGELYPPHA